jgi:hypothetical protein
MTILWSVDKDILTIGKTGKNAIKNLRLGGTYRIALNDIEEDLHPTVSEALCYVVEEIAKPTKLFKLCIKEVSAKWRTPEDRFSGYRLDAIATIEVLSAIDLKSRQTHDAVLWAFRQLILDYVDDKRWDTPEGLESFLISGEDKDLDGISWPEERGFWDNAWEDYLNLSAKGLTNRPWDFRDSMDDADRLIGVLALDLNKKKVEDRFEAKLLKWAEFDDLLTEALEETVA